MKRWLSRVVIGLAIAYPVSLVVATLLLGLVGEAWWATGVALYLPRAGFALPLVPLAAALWFLRARRLLWTQAVAALFVLFPLMGLTLPWFSPTTSSPKFRILSFNVDVTRAGNEALRRAITDHSPDVVLLQESEESSGLSDTLRQHYPSVHTSTQFVLATRFRVVETRVPEKLDYRGERRSPRFVSYLLETPLGKVAFYSVHPHSPRHAFYALRGKGMKRELLTGRFMRGVAGPDFEANAGLRELQVRTFTELAGREDVPVVIAGDFNLPSLSPVLRRHLSAYRDAFRDASSGFGYTYPSRRPWLRIDRIFTSAELIATTFAIGCRDVSDHRCVVADLGRAPR